MEFNELLHKNSPDQYNLISDYLKKAYAKDPADMRESKLRQQMRERIEELDIPDFPTDHYKAFASGKKTYKELVSPPSQQTTKHRGLKLDTGLTQIELSKHNRNDSNLL